MCDNGEIVKNIDFEIRKRYVLDFWPDSNPSYPGPHCTGQANYQKWRVGKGVIQSFCPHNYYVSTDDRYVALVQKQNYAGLKYARFGDEVEIHGDLNKASSLLLSELFKTVATVGSSSQDSSVSSPKLPENSWQKITTHGCWCSKMNNLELPYTGGDITVDQLDQICKDWHVARRCNNDINQPCYSGTSSTGGTDHISYNITIDVNAWPWTRKGQMRDVSCGLGEGNLNLNRCNKATCKLDVHFAMKIRGFLIEKGDSWRQVQGSEAVCTHYRHSSQTLSYKGLYLNDNVPSLIPVRCLKIYEKAPFPHPPPQRNLHPKSTSRSIPKTLSTISPSDYRATIDHNHQANYNTAKSECSNANFQSSKCVKRPKPTGRSGC